jgi:hypothetical protein
MDIVYAKDWVHAQIDGNIRRFPPGSHWPADDPYVRANPGQFDADPRYHLAFTEARPYYLGQEVEQATAAPGERRNTRR